MTQFIVVHKQSNLCVGVISSTYPPKKSTEYSFFKLNDKAQEYYYFYTASNPTLLDIGHLMAASSYVCDQVTRGRSGDAKPVKTTYRT